jgi:hypothetical protein
MMRITSNSKNVMRAAQIVAQQQISYIAEKMVPIAREFSPKLTGRNAESIECDHGKHTGGLGGYDIGRVNLGSVGMGGPVSRVFSTSGYGGWLEVGTFCMAPRPYLAPAYEKAKGRGGTKGGISVSETGLGNIK